MTNQFKVNCLYNDKNYPDNVHLCIKVDEANDMVHFKHISGELDWGYCGYYNEEEKLWWDYLSWAEKRMIELGPDCKAVRAIYL